MDINFATCYSVFRLLFEFPPLISTCKHVHCWLSQFRQLFFSNCHHINNHASIWAYTIAFWLHTVEIECCCGQLALIAVHSIQWLTLWAKSGSSNNQLLNTLIELLLTASFHKEFKNGCNWVNNMTVLIWFIEKHHGIKSKYTIIKCSENKVFCSVKLTIIDNSYNTQKI